MKRLTKFSGFTGWKNGKRRGIHLRNLHHPLTKQWGAWRNAYNDKVLHISVP